MFIDCRLEVFVVKKNDCKETVFTTNKEVEIKVYMKKGRIWLPVTGIALLFDKSPEAIKSIISTNFNKRKYNKNSVIYNEIILYDIDIIEKIGKMLESENVSLLKASFKEIGKNKLKDEPDWKKWYIIECILNILQDIF